MIEKNIIPILKYKFETILPVIFQIRILKFLCVLSIQADPREYLSRDFREARCEILSRIWCQYLPCQKLVKKKKNVKSRNIDVAFLRQPLTFVSRSPEGTESSMREAPIFAQLSRKSNFTSSAYLTRDRNKMAKKLPFHMTCLCGSFSSKKDRK